ncbi:MAG: hypothetical protein HYZ49_08805 [Chloroflexi bacterium]|nr:hypothetical protein [Chloroflexota bacterium]
MTTRNKFLSLILVLALLLVLAGPASAQTSGAGSITCDGDGTLVFTGDFATLSLSADAGALVYSKPDSGSIAISSGKTFVKHSANGNITIYVGSGSGTAKNVKNIKLTLSGANGHLEATGKGKLAVRGEGSCVTGGGKTYAWKSASDTTITVAP